MCMDCWHEPPQTLLGPSAAKKNCVTFFTFRADSEATSKTTVPYYTMAPFGDFLCLYLQYRKRK